MANNVLVIGAGIIGACAAAYLQREGFAVTLVERDYPAAGASSGNCAGIATAEIVPLSRPGLLRRLPKLLLDSEGPLAIRPVETLRSMPWLLRFLAASRVARVREISHGLAALTHRAYEDFSPILEDAGLKDLITGEDCIEVFDRRQEMEFQQFAWDLKRECGFELDWVPGADLPDLEPALARDLAGGLVFKGWRHVADTKGLVQGLVDHVVAGGGRYVNGEASELLRDDDKVFAVELANGERLSCDQVVVAAGPWSGRLLPGLKAPSLIHSLSGYGTDLPDPDISLGRKVIYHTGGFVMTPMHHGLRIAGTIEIAGLDPKPNFRRAEILVQKAARVIPGLNAKGGERWMRQRPFMPDTLPIIDRAPGLENVIIASGHGQLGLTLGGVTGRLVADMAGGGKPSVDLTPYSARRFF